MKTKCGLSVMSPVCSPNHLVPRKRHSAWRMALGEDFLLPPLEKSFDIPLLRTKRPWEGLPTRQFWSRQDGREIVESLNVATLPSTKKKLRWFFVVKNTFSDSSKRQAFFKLQLIKHLSYVYKVMYLPLKEHC